MHALSLGAGKRIERMLAIGAHADDIEIGCGGTVLQLAEMHPDAEILWLVLSADGVRADEAHRSALEFTAGFGSSRIFVESFRDGFFPYDGGAVKERFEALKHEISPDLIFTHRSGDRHQDHRLVCELTWNTFRDHLILEYEIPKYDGDLGAPNLFVPLGQESYKRKVRYIMDAFETQRAKRWFEKEIFLALMRLRGMECIAPTGYAEAFYCRKLVV